MRALLLGLAKTNALNILALHGGGGDAASMEGQLTGIRAAMGSGHTFVYASGPSSYGGLWIRDPPGGKENPTTDPNWASASFAALDALVSSHGPFDGIMGYSQGGAMTLLYLSQRSANFTGAYPPALFLQHSCSAMPNIRSCVKHSPQVSS